MLVSTCNATPKSNYGRAVSYTINQWSYLTNYLLDGRLDISNNRAEHLAKSFAVCRKNFVFSNISKGAESSVITYSIVATVIQSDLSLTLVVGWVEPVAKS